MEGKIEIVKRETIKPSSPTPPELREFKLSRFDQLNPAMYGPFILFYLGDEGDDNKVREYKLVTLKTSLSETLKHFYQYAGRIRDNIAVECNDEGIEFIETSVDARLPEVLEKPNAVVLKEFLPIEVTSPEAATGWLFLVQANFFKCGGLAVGTCLSHKLTDVSSMSTFINAWAGVARGSPDVVFPILTAASMFPPLDELAGPLSAVEIKRSNCISRRYVIGPSAIAILKKNATSNAVLHPSAVEVVVSLIWKCAAKAFRANFESRNQSSIMSQAINLRKRFDPKLPENLVGNLASVYFSHEVELGSELQTLVANLRKGCDECHRDVVEKLQQQNDFSRIYEAIKRFGEYLHDDQLQFYSCSSWCKLPFYEVDFGWGSPIWVTTANAEINNSLVLINTKPQDGIEVWLSLSEEIMSTFEKDEELLEFASLNPSVL